MPGARDLMSPEQPVARAGAAGARADRGRRAAQDVRLRGASRVASRRGGRDPRPRPSPRAHRAGLGRRVRRGPGRRRGSVAPQVVARVGSAARAGPARRLGGLALVGAGVVLLGGVVTRDDRAHAARSSPARRRTAGARGHERSPGLDLGTTLTEAGRHDGAPATSHRSHRPRPLRRRPPGRVCPGRQHRRAGPLDRVGGAAHGPPRPAGLPDHGGVGRGAGGMAGGGREPRRCLGPGAAAGRRGRARRARRRLPGGECAHLQRGRGAARTSRPGGCPVHPRVAGPARRAGGAGRPAHGDAPGPSGARGLAGARTGGPPGRRPAHGDVLRRVRATGPVGPGRRRGRGPRAPGVRVQPDGRRPLAGLPALRGAGPLCPLRCRGGPAAGRGGAAVPALRRDAPGRLRGVRALAHEDAAAGSEPATRGTGGTAGGGGGGGDRCGPQVRGQVRTSRCSRRRPCSSAPRPCCTGSAAPPPWPSWTSICTCWRPGSPPPRTPWRSSCAPPGSSGAAGSGPPWVRVQVQTRVPEHPVLTAVAGGEPAGGAGGGCGAAPCVVLTAVLRARAGVGRAGTRPTPRR